MPINTSTRSRQRKGVALLSSGGHEFQESQLMVLCNKGYEIKVMKERKGGTSLLGKTSPHVFAGTRSQYRFGNEFPSSGAHGAVLKESLGQASPVGTSTLALFLNSWSSTPGKGSERSTRLRFCKNVDSFSS